MKKLALGVAAALILLGVSFAAQKDSSFSGEISDRACAKANSHADMMKRHNVQTTADCIPACVKAGGKYVLFDTATMTIYMLDDQQKPAQFAGQKVKVIGTYDKATETIHVTDIKAELIASFHFSKTSHINNLCGSRLQPRHWKALKLGLYPS